MTTNLFEEFNKLAELPDDSEPKHKRKRGRDLEVFFKSWLHKENLDPKIRIKNSGEEIDGSFVLNNRVYLLEVKWHKKELPASSIYMFKGKVDGKLVGTIGVFISISGFSKDAIDALQIGKDLNVILFDKNDVLAALKSSEGFKNGLEVKMRAASESGTVHFPLQSQEVSKNLESIHKPEIAIKMVETTELRDKDEPSLIIICEGLLDRQILTEFVAHAITDTMSNKRVRIAAAGGKHSIISLANNLHGHFVNSNILIVVDADLSIKETKSFIKDNMQFEPHGIFTPNPSIEYWLIPESNDPKMELMNESKKSKISLLQLASIKARGIKSNILEDKDVEFKNFYRKLINLLN